MKKMPPLMQDNLPDLEAARTAFTKFCETIAALRHPLQGCPWDLKQDHKTLRRYMLEEAYEAAEAMSSEDYSEIRDELGDVLLQVVLNAQIAQDKKHFSIVDVTNAINEKMIRRHPHVFGEKNGVTTFEQVRSTWAEEKAAGAKPRAASTTFADAEKKTPASAQAVKIGKIAQKVRFDWDNADEVLAQLESEIKEVRAEFAAAKRSPERISEELGDVFFSLAQLCRHLDLDPELVALDGNRKFLRRFAIVEKLAAAKGKAIAASTREELEALWTAAKKES